MKAICNGQVIAESETTVVVEGNHYFPRASLADEFFTTSQTTSICSWKGTAHYFDIVVDGSVNSDAAWYYPETKPAADHIAGYVAFWRDVKVER